MGKKCDFDKFYTNPNVVKDIMKFVDLDAYDLIIEPSAGNGSFSNEINGFNLVALDLAPESDDIIEQDWFKYKIPSKYENVLIIGNPPFGERNKLSKDFIKHALSFPNVKTISFVLPNVYKKHTNQKLFPKNWRLAQEITLPEDSFILEGEPYHVPCTFFIWTQFLGLKDLRFKEELYKTHPDFEFSTEKDFDFFVMGASPTVIKSAEEISSTNRGYYIKSHIYPEKLKHNIKNIEWSKFGNSSANGGVSWFSKPEFVKTYDENKPI